jgi:hypothetical protein
VMESGLGIDAKGPAVLAHDPRQVAAQPPDRPRRTRVTEP